MNRRQLLMSNNWGSVYTPPRAGLAAQFDARFGITSSGGFASAWADQSGNGRSLLQVTGANQPIHLPFSGTKYGWLSGDVGNYFSTPDSVLNSNSPDKIEAKLALKDWTPAIGNIVAGKRSGAGQITAVFYVASGGALALFASLDGTASSINASSTANISFTDGGDGYVKYERNESTGVIKFFTSPDGVTWSQLGADVAGVAGALYNSTSPWEIGSQLGGTSSNLAGAVYWVKGYSASTPIFDFNPQRDYGSGSTFTSSTTGETWTINSTGSKPAQIVDRPSLLFDGAAHYMKSTFALNQPETVYIVGKQVTWTLNDVIFDGGAAPCQLLQNSVTPRRALYAGTAIAAENTSGVIGTTDVICAVFSGASSSLQYNTGAASTGNPGAQNPGGFTIGSSYLGTGFANIQAYEALIYNVAHDAATRANIIRALMSKHGVTT